MMWIVAMAIAWIVGGIPFGVMIGRLKGIDIREHGSRNVGATNVGRVLGRRWGLVCFLLDALKGAGPVVGAGLWAGTSGRELLTLSAGESAGWLGVAVAAVAGHMASPFLRLRGGKGVATALGALAATWPLMTVPVLLAFVVWGITLAWSRLVSLASIVAAGSLPFGTAAWWFVGAKLLAPAPVAGEIPATTADIAGRAAPSLIIATALAVLVIWRHRSNITRIRAGTESPIGASREA
ncbi:MAG: glycerol-3-phosphate 1-O-acyltransferase PlsY [Phycisphaerales bacterium]